MHYHFCPGLNQLQRRRKKSFAIQHSVTHSFTSFRNSIGQQQRIHQQLNSLWSLQQTTDLRHLSWAPVHSSVLALMRGPRSKPTEEDVLLQQKSLPSGCWPLNQAAIWSVCLPVSVNCSQSLSVALYICLYLTAGVCYCLCHSACGFLYYSLSHLRLPHPHQRSQRLAAAYMYTPCRRNDWVQLPTAETQLMRKTFEVRMPFAD